jgi:hypothetical protein
MRLQYLVGANLSLISTRTTEQRLEPNELACTYQSPKHPPTSTGNRHNFFPVKPLLWFVKQWLRLPLDFYYQNLWEISTDEIFSRFKAYTKLVLAEWHRTLRGSGRTSLYL